MIKAVFEKGTGYNNRDVLRIVKSTTQYRVGETLDYGKLGILASQGIKIQIN